VHELISTTEPCRMYWQDDNLYSGGRQHVSQLKGTCLQSPSATGFSAILLCCELCEAVQVHKRYRDQLRLYRQGLTSLNSQPSQIINSTALKLQLDWEKRYIVKLTMKRVSISEIFVFWCHLTPASVRENSTIFQHGWHELDEACWLVKNNIQVLYMHKCLNVKDVGKKVPKKGDS
jgi:hypothetical protein